MSSNHRLHPLFILIGSLLVTSAITFFLTPILGKTSVYLLYVLIIFINTWYSNKQYGLMNVILIFLHIVVYFFFYKKISSIHSLVSLLEVAFFIGVSVSITILTDKISNTDEIKAYKQNEKFLTEELEKQKNELNKVKFEIKKRDEFLSIASHELKTPLTSMLLKIQIILHNIRNVSLAKFSVENLLKQLITAEHQTQRLSRMINDLLNVSLITTGKLHLEPEKVNLSELVKEVVNEFSEKIEKSGTTVKVEANDAIECYIDKLRIEQVVTNLLSNAIKYGDDKPIEVSVSKNNTHAFITVKDNGIGIPSNQHKNIFALFERGEINSNYKGLGVGLFISNQIISSHQGSIKVVSEKNKGATFIVELPLHASPVS